MKNYAELELVRGSCLGASRTCMRDFECLCAFHRAKAIEARRPTVPAKKIVPPPDMRLLAFEGISSALFSVLKGYTKAVQRGEVFAKARSKSIHHYQEYERAVLRSALNLLRALVHDCSASAGERHVSVRKLRHQCVIHASALLGSSVDQVPAWIQITAITLICETAMRMTDESARISSLRNMAIKVRGRKTSMCDVVRIAAECAVDDGHFSPHHVALLSGLVERIRGAVSYTEMLDSISCASALCSLSESMGNWLAQTANWPLALSRVFDTCPTTPRDDDMLMEAIFFLSCALDRMGAEDGSRKYLVLVICRDRLVRLLDRTHDALTVNQIRIPRHDLRMSIVSLINSLLGADVPPATFSNVQNISLPCSLETAFTLSNEGDLVDMLCGQYINPQDQFSIRQTGQKVDDLLLAASVECLSRLCMAHAVLQKRNASGQAMPGSHFTTYTALSNAKLSLVLQSLSYFINSRRWALPPNSTGELALAEAVAHAKAAVQSCSKVH